MPSRSSRPLEGIRVLDLTVALAGPYGSLMLGGLGAEVIRIEAPGGSDLAGTIPPFVGDGTIHFGAKADGDIPLTTLNRKRNKKCITLDLKTEEGREIFLRLVRESDVVIENMSEGATARLKIDYESVRQVNPKLVYASIKAFGEPSAYPELKGMDIIIQALSGLMQITGVPEGPPTRIGVPIADMVAPLHAVTGILSALIYRGRTGEGQHVKVSMLDCLASWVAEEHFDVFGKAGYPMRSGNFLDRLVPFGVYPSKDGYVAIVAFQPDWMKGLLDVMGQPDLVEDPRFSSRGTRMKNAAAFNAIIVNWSTTLASDEIVHELLHKRGVPAAKVRSPDEVLRDPLLHESGAVVNLRHPRYGDIGAVGMGLPIQFSKCEAQYDQPASELGAANGQIYGELLKLSGEEMERLRAAGVI